MIKLGMSPAEAAKLIEGLDDAAKAELLAKLSAAQVKVDAVKAAAETNKARLAKISAMRQEPTATFKIAEGLLHRAGIALEDVTDVRNLDKLLASASRISNDDRWTTKTILNKLGLLSD